MHNKVMVAMSGGVDSSVAAALLQEQGYEITGATLRLFAGAQEEGETQPRACCSLSDVEDARRVAHRLGAEHHVFNFTDLFKSRVMDRFAASYLAGETPNPCIDCNRFIKFELMLERALLLGMDYIATGHYARVERDGATGRYLLRKAADPRKDQTYVLYAMTQEQLAHTLFPLGGLEKQQVRALAESHGFRNAAKPDSQDICFVPDGDYAGFLAREMGVEAPPGAFVTTEGRVVGEHRGLVRYTVGQRRGLGLSLGRPQYVVGKDPHTNTVTVGEERDLYQSRVRVNDLNLIAAERLESPVRAAVKTRYSQKEADATLYPLENGLLEAVFDQPQRAPAAGQAAVFYQGDLVLGGGTICRADRA